MYTFWYSFTNSPDTLLMQSDQSKVADLGILVGSSHSSTIEIVDLVFYKISYSDLLYKPLCQCALVWGVSCLSLCLSLSLSNLRTILWSLSVSLSFSHILSICICFKDPSVSARDIVGVCRCEDCEPDQEVENCTEVRKAGKNFTFWWHGH